MLEEGRNWECEGLFVGSRWIVWGKGCPLKEGRWGGGEEKGIWRELTQRGPKERERHHLQTDNPAVLSE